MMMEHFKIINNFLYEDKGVIDKDDVSVQFRFTLLLSYMHIRISGYSQPLSRRQIALNFNYTSVHRFSVLQPL